MGNPTQKVQANLSISTKLKAKGMVLAT